MATAYTVDLGHNYIPPNAADAADTAEPEADTPFEHWLDWLEETRETIAEGDGDPDDIDAVIALALEHIVGGGPDAVATRDARLEEVLRDTQASNDKITVFLQRQREARKTQKAETAALAGRLDRMADQIGSLTRENSSLRTTLENVEENLRQATAMLEKEIARERSLRRLLDAQRSRPHTQRVASELAKRHAAKALEVGAKSKTEAA